MGGLASFLGGAAKTVKKKRDDEYALEQEMQMMEAKARLEANLRKQYEKLAQGIDTTTGEMYTVYGDGKTENTKLPKAAIDKYESDLAIAAEERQMKKDKQKADIEYRTTSSDATARRAAAAEMSAAATAERARTGGIADAARARKYDADATRGPKAKEDKTITNLVSDIAATDPEAKIRAIAIKNSPLPEAEKKAKLQALLGIATQEALRKAALKKEEE